MFSLKGRIGPALASLVLLASAGCGGNGGHSSGSSNAALRMTMAWPEVEARFVPNASNSIVAVVKVRGKEVARGLFVRPGGDSGEGSSTTMLLQRLPAGKATVTLTAYPSDDGTGTPQAKGTATETLVRGQITEDHASMASTIDTLTLTPSAVSVAPGEQFELDLQAKDAAGATVLLATRYIEDLTVTSSAPGVATVDANGMITGVSAGTANVSVSLVVNDGGGTKTASVPVTVAVPARTLVSIHIDAGPTFGYPYQQQFTATATYSDSTTEDVTNSVTWNSNNPDLPISAAGVMTVNTHSGSASFIGDFTAVSGAITSNVIEENWD